MYERISQKMGCNIYGFLINELALTRNLFGQQIKNNFEITLPDIENLQVCGVSIHIISKISERPVQIFCLEMKPRFSSGGFYQKFDKLGPILLFRSSIIY